MIRSDAGTREKKMKKITKLKALFLCAILAFAYSGIVAQADSLVGYWVGSFSGVGKSGGASASFSSGGGCTVSALGISASGSYGGGSMHVSSHGYSITLHYSVRGDHMTISGSKGGYSGSISLTRVGGAGDRSGNEQIIGEGDPAVVMEKVQALSGQWTGEANGTRYGVSLYTDGFLCWVETPLAEGSESRSYGARLKVSTDVLTLTPLDQATPGEVPVLWTELDSGDAWELSYSVGDDDLMLMQGDAVLLTLCRVKDTDETPAEAIFRPYIVLKQGAKGEVVRQLQQALIDGGFLTGEADGVFGPATKKAVKAFQKANGLKADGIADGEVLTALLK
jgi:hypothetical protein